MNKKLILWISAAVITFLVSFLHQRTGPYYPVSGSVGIEGKKLTYFFDKVHYGKEIPEVKLRTDIEGFKGKLLSRKRGTSEWKQSSFSDMGEYLSAFIEDSFPGDTVDYKTVVKYNNREYDLPSGHQVTMVLLGKRPLSVLYVLYFFLFGGLLIAVRGGLEYFNPSDKSTLFALLAALFFFVASVIFFPFVRSYELDVINKNIPTLSSLFDLPLLFIFLLWAAALTTVIKIRRKIIMLLAAVITLILYQFVNFY